MRVTALNRSTRFDYYMGLTRLTQIEAAIYLGVSQPTIGNWSVGRSNPEPTAFTKLEELAARIEEIAAKAIESRQITTPGEARVAVDYSGLPTISSRLAVNYEIFRLMFHTADAADIDKVIIVEVPHA